MKERPDHSNYEAWLLDRLEGNFDPEQAEMLDDFLAANPGLDPGVGPLPTVASQRAKLTKDDKSALKRSLPPTGSPTATNIDDFLVARLEGDLDAAQLLALERYLSDHPEQERAYRHYALTKVVPGTEVFDASNELRRELPPAAMPDRYNLEDLLVARLEGDLSVEQEKALDNLLGADAIAMRSWELMRRTRLSADRVLYPDKQGLKKGGRVIAFTPWVVRLAAAASIALLIGVGSWFLLRTELPVERIADVAPKPNENIAKVEPVLADRSVASEEVDQQSVVSEPDDGPVAKGGHDATVPKSVRKPEPPKPVQVPAPKPLPAPNETPMADHGVIPDKDRKQPPAAQSPLASVAPDPKKELPEQIAGAATPAPEATTLGGALAATLRERVLDEPVRDTRPLDGNDAVAALDKGLRALGGQSAGLAVERHSSGAVSSFKLRLGRGLAISASR